MTKSNSCKIKTFSCVSLDGFVSKMGGDIDWITEYPRPENEDYRFGDFYRSVGSIVLNGIAYAMLQSCDLSPLGDKPCHVITPNNFGIEPESGVNFIQTHRGGNDSIIEILKSLRNEADRDIWLVGDRELISLCLDYRLIDEITLNMIPVTLGSGTPLFNRHKTEQDWKLLDCHKFINGVVQLKYAVEHQEIRLQMCCKQEY